MGIGVAVVALLMFGAGTLAVSRIGRLVLLGGLVALPVMLSAGNLSVGVHESSTTRFCLSCHEMQRHGMSLFVDDRHALAAVHYQDRLVDRDAICYSCHKDYALFGDMKAKLNGLRHVWVHYFRPVPARIELYQPYPNKNCLHCHEDARPFVEAPSHRPVLEGLLAGGTSCLSCHRVVHDLVKVDARVFWQAK
ncbi:MAG: NapC/NirT family cytochrome c [Pseudomonadota bacterium]